MRNFIILIVFLIPASAYGQCYHCLDNLQPENTYSAGTVQAAQYGRARVRQGASVFQVGLINIVQGMHKTAGSSQSANVGKNRNKGIIRKVIGRFRR